MTSSLPPPDLSLTTENMGELGQYAVDLDKFPADKEPTWTIPPSKDGWTHAHNALRGEIDMISKAMSQLAAAETFGEDGKLPEDELWKVESMTALWKHHSAHVRAHQEAEETIMQPVLVERIKYPEKLTGGHKLLDDFLAKVDTALETFTQDPTAETAKALFEKAYWPYQVDLREHLHAEEVWGIPLMRAYFSQEEFNPTGKAMGKNSGPPGSFVYFMGRDETTLKYHFQTEFMPQRGMPSFLWYVVFEPALWQFQKDFLRHAQALIETNKPPVDESSCQIM